MTEMNGFDSMITFLYTEDMDACHSFYSDVLNLPMVLDQGGCRIYRTAADAYIGFCSKRKPEQLDAVTITLVTSDVDLWFEKVREAGCEVIKPPAFTPEYNIYNCFFRDPCGYTLEIQRFEDPRWPPKV